MEITDFITTFSSYGTQVKKLFTENPHFNYYFSTLLLDRFSPIYKNIYIAYDISNHQFYTHIDGTLYNINGIIKVKDPTNIFDWTYICEFDPSTADRILKQIMGD